MYLGNNPSFFLHDRLPETSGGTELLMMSSSRQVCANAHPNGHTRITFFCSIGFSDCDHEILLGPMVYDAIVTVSA